MSNYVYVVNYLENKENYSIPIGVFENNEDAIDYILINSDNEFTNDLNNGGCDICEDELDSKEIEYVCTDCCDYHLCVDCYSQENEEHRCDVIHKLIHIKNRINFDGFTDKNGFYYIHKVLFN